jgi:hypothetical protein
VIVLSLLVVTTQQSKLFADFQSSHIKQSVKNVSPSEIHFRKYACEQFGIGYALNMTGDLINYFTQPSEKTEFYFKCTGLNRAKYIHFQPDGIYKYYLKHSSMFAEYDSGTWELDSQNVFHLRSTNLVRNIQYGSLTIEFPGKNEVAQLPGLKTQVIKYLKKNKKIAFNEEEVEGIYNKRGLVISVTSTNYPITRIQRSDLEELLKKIDLYLESNELNHIQAKLCTYKSYQYLIWSEFESSLNQSEDQIKEKIDKAEKVSRKILPSLVFIRIEKDFFPHDLVPEQEYYSDFVTIQNQDSFSRKESDEVRYDKASLDQWYASSIYLDDTPYFSFPVFRSPASSNPIISLHKLVRSDLFTDQVYSFTTTKNGASLSKPKKNWHLQTNS